MSIATTLSNPFFFNHKFLTLALGFMVRDSILKIETVIQSRLAAGNQAGEAALDTV